jgi:hypothetical protein
MALINPFRSSKKLDSLKSQIQSLGPDFHVTGGLQDPPTQNAIAAAESQLAVKFNPEYRDMLKWAGHLVIEVSENVWPRARDGFVGPAWTFDYGFSILGTGSGIPDSLDVAKIGAELSQRLGSPVVPFLRWVYSTDYLCFDQNGRVFEWRWQGPFTRLSKWTGWKEEGVIFYDQSNPMYQKGRETFELAPVRDSVLAAVSRSLVDLQEKTRRLEREHGQWVSTNRLMNVQDTRTRVRAVDLLRAIQEPEPEAFEALRGAANDADLEVARAASSALGDLARKQLPRLLAQLKAGKGDERREAACRLGAMGRWAASATPHLTEALNDVRATVSRAASEALQKLREPAHLSEAAEAPGQPAPDAAGQHPPPTPAAEKPR